MLTSDLLDRAGLPGWLIGPFVVLVILGALLGVGVALAPHGDDSAHPD